MKKAKLFAFAAISALLTACGGGGQTVPASNPQLQQQAPSDEFRTISLFRAQNVVTGDTVRIFPTTDAVQAYRLAHAGERTTQAVNNLLYGGGPIQTAPQLYVVFWGSAWNGAGDPKGVAARIKAFDAVMGGSRWLNSVTQYTQSGGQHVGNAAGSFIGSYVDTTSSPPSRPSQSQLAAEAARAAAHFGNSSINASYVVALPHGIRPSGFGTQYCAYHSTTNAGVPWTNLPYLPDVGASCGAGSVNNPGTLDGVSIVGGHEQGETETDPDAASGWIDINNEENGDKCAWTNLENNPNAGGFPTQPLWSNASSSCVQSF